MAAADSKTKWTETLAGRIAGGTAILAATAGLVNGAIDLGKAILSVPDNVYDRTNEELFKKNFNKQPVVSQPVTIKSASLSVEMLLQVYESGDVFVRYGKFQQWLPFREPKIASISFVPQAWAQSTLKAPPEPSSPVYSAKLGTVMAVPFVIDIDKLKQNDQSSLEGARASKVFNFSELQNPKISFSPTTVNYEQIFRADPGTKFTDFNFQLGSTNNSRVKSVKLIEDGLAIRVEYDVTSGPIFDQYRGWIKGTVNVQQERLK